MAQRRDPEDRAALLARYYPALVTAPADLVAELVSASRPFDAQPGAVLFDLDGPCTGFVLIFAGTVEVGRPSPTGRQLLLYRLGPGDTCVLTVNCLVGLGNYPARGVVRERTRGAIVPRRLFERLLAEVPAFRAQTLGLFSRRLSRLLSLMEAMAFSPVEQRLAALLAEHSPRMVVTQQELADMAGTAREVVSRQLGTWTRAGLISTSRGAVTVLLPDRLKAIAEPLGGV